MSDKPWKLVTLHHEDYYFTQEEYDLFVSKLGKVDMANINGQFFQTKFISLTKNPTYIDQKKVQQLREIIEKQKEEARKKYE